LGKTFARITNYLPGFTSSGDAYLGVGVISAIYFLGIARLDPDLHHDGVQFAAAAGIADGLHVHSQVFEQYGPITAWVQGITLKNFGPYLINLRIENAILFTLIGLITLKLLLTLNVPVLCSFLVVIAWVLSCPVTSIPRISYGYAFWPWPSAISTLLLMLNSLLLISVHKRERRIRRWENFALAISCSVLLFTRIQVGVLATATCLVCVVWSGKSQGSKVHLIKDFCLGFFGANLIFIGILGLQGSLSAFVSQVITGSLNRYGNPFNWNFYKDYYLFGSLPFVLLLVLSIFNARFSRARIRLAGQFILAISFFSALYYANISSIPDPNVSNAEFFTLNQLSFSFIYASIPILGGIVLLALLAPSLKLMPFRAFRTKADQEALNPIDSRSRLAIIFESQNGIHVPILLCLIPFIAQLYPMADQIHLWWIAPYPLIVVTVFIRDYVNRIRLNQVLTPLLIPLVLISAHSFTDFKSIPRAPVINQNIAFRGMLVNMPYLNSYNGFNSLLSTVAPRSAKFDCRDGLFATWGGTYLAADANYVNWAWGTDSDEGGRPATRMFICASPEAAKLFAENNGYQLVEPGVKYSFGLYSSGTIFEYTPINK
jgi:hypothetical protein